MKIKPERVDNVILWLHSPHCSRLHQYIAPLVCGENCSKGS